MRKMVVTLSVMLLTGCTVRTPAVMRQDCRHSYSVAVKGDWQQVYGNIAGAMIRIGWGEEVAIHQESHPEMKSASAWAYLPNRRDPIGFIVDVEDAGEGQARVTVYAESSYYARKSREWLGLGE